MIRLKHIFSCLTVLILMFITVNTGHAITVTTSLDPAVVKKPVTFYIDMGDTNCMMSVNFGDGGGLQVVGTPPTTTMTITHTYARPGLYNIKVEAGSCNLPSAPNPAFLSLRVSDFNITRLALEFENNRPEITIQRNAPAPKLEAQIRYSGTGYLKGYLEVDGYKRHQVFKHLRTGPTVTIPYPEIPSLPTFTPGSHRVRFVITYPVLNITFPTAIYYVEAREYIVQGKIILTAPGKRAALPYEPVQFAWVPAKKTTLYLINLFSKKDKTRLFSAYTRKNTYSLDPVIFKSRFVPEKEYLWQIQGFNSDNEIIAQSEQRTFALGKQTAWIPGHILLVTKMTPQADQAIADIRNRFDLQILHQYEIVTLNSKLTLLFTQKGIFEIINAIDIKDQILMVQPDFIFQTISEPLESIQGLNALFPADFQKSAFTGKGIKIGIVDTGIETDHEDLKSAVIYSGNFISGQRAAGEIHGTAVAGLIAARKNNFGIKGIAPDTAVLSLRACRQISKDSPAGECYSDSLVQAIDAGIQRGAKIINMSLGTTVEDPLMSRLISAGFKKGTLFVAPVGNRTESTQIRFPASHPNVISVAGKKKNGTVFPNETLAGKSDFLAPYQNLFTSVPGNAHNFISGTSMSAAFVTGVLALSCEDDPNFSPDDLSDFKGDIDSLIRHLIPSE